MSTRSMPSPALSPDLATGFLSIQGLTRRFGGVTALDRVDMTVQEGTVVGLIGPNGAGKTTLFNAITGFGRADEGTVTFRGERIERMPAYQIARRGMVRTFQTIRMFPGLTVYESLLAPRAGTGYRGARERAEETLHRLGLEPLADRLCSELPLLAQRTVEVGRALMTDPKVLLLDEPTAGATVSEREALVRLITQLREDGVTVIVIEHNVPFVLAVSTRIVVLNFGKVVATGDPSSILADPIVQEIYLG